MRRNFNRHQQTTTRRRLRRRGRPTVFLWRPTGTRLRIRLEIHPRHLRQSGARSLGKQSQKNMVQRSRPSLKRRRTTHRSSISPTWTTWVTRWTRFSTAASTTACAPARLSTPRLSKSAGSVATAANHGRTSRLMDAPISAIQIDIIPPAAHPRTGVAANGKGFGLGVMGWSPMAVEF